MLPLAGKPAHRYRPVSSNVRPRVSLCHRCRASEPPSSVSARACAVVTLGASPRPRLEGRGASASRCSSSWRSVAPGGHGCLSRPLRLEARDRLVGRWRGALGTARGLTLRSSADCPRRAGLAARRRWSMLRRAAKPSHRGQPLSSNVRRHESHPCCRPRASQLGSWVVRSELQARCSRPDMFPQHTSARRCSRPPTRSWTRPRTQRVP